MRSVAASGAGAPHPFDGENVRRTVLSTLILASLAFAGEAAAQARGPRGAAGSFLLVGWQRADLDALNTALATHGYPEFSKDFVALGAGGYRRFGRLLVGAEAATLVSTDGTVDADDFELRLSGGQGALDLGYALIDGPIRLYPLAAIGVSGLCLRISETGRVRFDDVLDRPGRSIEMNQAALLLRLGLAVERPFGGERGGFVLGLRAGYAFAPFTSDWGTDDDALDIVGGPDARAKGLFLGLTLGGEARRRRS